MGAQKTESQKRIDALGKALGKMKSSTTEASHCCDQLTKRARQLDSLTSPASDASSMLSKASNNLGSTLVLMKDAREKFDTVRDCEPAIERLHRGVLDVQSEKSGNRKARNPFQDDTKGKIVLSEQDIYAAADSMEIIRDAFEYFIDRTHWRSTATALASLERVHQMGVSSMCVLASLHLVDAGQAVRLKRVVKQEGETHVTPSNETAQQTRERLSKALQNRDLLRSIGEFEEYQPVEARLVRELRGIFECLSGNGFQLHPLPKKESPGLAHIFGLPANRVVRTEKVGAGGFSNLIQRPLKSGFPHVDAYGEARKTTAFSSIDAYHRRVRAERKRNAERNRNDLVDEADAAARDAVRCLEHAMIVVAGEKNVYRTIVTPSLTKIADEDAVNDEISPFYRKACAAAYSHVVACVVDKTMDIIETMFLKEGGIGHASGSKGENQSFTVQSAASSASGGLRILDGVRMLGPSLAKLCDMPIGDGTAEKPSLASTLCIAIHRTTVKNCARTLENLAKAIQEDPLKGTAQRAKDARVAPLTCDVVRAVRMVSPYVSAYKSVSKRRQLPWDPNMGEDAGELESFIRFLIMRLLNSLKGKSLTYTKHAGDLGQARSNMFMMNNAFYLRDELGPPIAALAGHDDDQYRIESSWFVDKINKLYESEKSKYLGHWEVLNTHLTSVEHDELEYQKNEKILSLDSGRLIKNRFSGFNEDFERLWEDHKDLCVVDPRLRNTLQKEVAGVFLPLYSKFYDKYSQIRFSKKHQDEYTKFSPYKIEQMLDELYIDAE
mmetsp:Transcript_8200/g.23562  ORF Transcript_8200/g.23562 Transcript_8200/m.23562 type:complete len:781 (-) Transcript_8200:133-2475(-)|eukprot:CAMPEP_0119554766 /NCGR_PEP_ID=MMETSP1352-20130426/7150_1 /TAXON_ID=265584 /ORGANISM="Stauroneis constricta, Strain CCMP1120" /LENGTH=780 /DNA_ID=CAMNT_0007601405 /DNA_START=94 /DNA_END=2436 /DNA_ORIENTATION=-